MELKEILQSDEKFRYQLLGRLKSDCDYYLGYGDRNTNRLWAGNETKQINAMKELWKSFDNDGKPEWFTWDDILEYEIKMKE